MTLTPRTLVSGLYYKPMTIVNDNSRVVNMLEALLTDDARVVIYECHMFIIQATKLSFEHLRSILLIGCLTDVVKRPF
jgi:hypothetical protein